MPCQLACRKNCSLFHAPASISLLWCCCSRGRSTQTTQTQQQNQQNKRGAYKSWSKDDMTHALRAVRSAKNSPYHLSFDDAECIYHIPHSTLYDYVQKTTTAIASAPRGSLPNDITDTVIQTTRSGTPVTLLDSESEHKLLTWVFRMEEMCIPVDLDQLRYKAMRLHFSANNIPITAENELKVASKQWWYRFHKRHPELSLRAPQKIEYLRLRATQPEIIQHFYRLLKHAIDTYGFTEDDIWAADETGVDEHGRCTKALARKGTNMPRKNRLWVLMFDDRGIFFPTNMVHFLYREKRRENQGVWVSSTHLNYMLCQWKNHPSPLCIQWKIYKKKFIIWGPFR